MSDKNGTEIQQMTGENGQNNSRRMMLKGAAALSFLSVAGGLAGCQTPPPAPQFPPIRFNHLPPFRLNVALVDLVNNFRPAAGPSFVEGAFPLPPAAAAMQWAQDRLQAVGRGGSVAAILMDASVQEIPLEVKKGIEGVFTTDQSERYDATLSMRLELTRPDGSQGVVVTATAKRNQTVAEDITLNERNIVWYRLTQSLMQDFNAEMERQMSSPSMQPFLVR